MRGLITRASAAVTAATALGALGMAGVGAAGAAASGPQSPAVTGHAPAASGALIAYPGMALPAVYASAGQPARGGARGRVSYRDYGSSAVRALISRYYTGSGTWNMCVPATCAQRNADWGADSLKYSLYLHWQLTGDPAVRPIMRALAGTARTYTAYGGEWSDGPEWDAVADAREYQVTRNPVALTDGEAAFRIVDSADASHFAAGACPGIDYQQAGGGPGKLKTLETDSSYIKAALLLYQITGNTSYLAKAQKKYQAVRKYYLSLGSALYTAHVIDSGESCEQVPGLFFASVNGNISGTAPRWPGRPASRST